MNSSVEGELLGVQTGWLPDLPDARDYTIAHPKVRPFLENAGVAGLNLTLPGAGDLREDFPPVFDQNPLNSCTAVTTGALSGYFQKRAFGRDLSGSILFLYKVSRNLLQVAGDTGAFLRTGMEALRLFGILPDQYWPYDPARLDAEPAAFHYLFAANFKAKSYYRLDEPGISREQLLQRIKTNAAAHLPAMFGLFLFPSVEMSVINGEIPLPGAGETPIALHALVVAGYDDDKEIRNSAVIPAVATRGAFRVRNSWGAGWGDLGYGWLPYDYLLRGLTSDWWSLVESDFIDIGQFGIR